MAASIAADRTTEEFTWTTRREPLRVRVKVAADTHPGRVRAHNEDHYLVAKLAKSMRIVKTSLPGNANVTRFSDEDGYLMVVADGMGGASAGEKASALAVASVEQFALNTLKWFFHLGGDEEHTLLGELRQALERADRTVVERAHGDSLLAGMGTTLTMAYSVATDLYIVHAGDSRAYLLRQGHLEQITTDHTLVQALVQSGRISPEAARHHHRRHVITNALGGAGEGVDAEIHKVTLADDDRLLLCTDGLCGVVDDAELAHILEAHPDLEEACRHLVETSLRAGGPDNITVVLARYELT